MTADAEAGPAHGAPAAQSAGVRSRRSAGRASPETLRLYATDWIAFETWCAAAGRVALPADATTVAAFLTDGATTLSAGALGRRACAIGLRHRQHGVLSPTANKAVKAVLRTARQDAGPRRAVGPEPAQLMRMAAACRGDLTGLRDRALLLLAVGGLGPSALVGLDVEHIDFAAGEAALTLNVAGKGVDRLTIPCGADLSVCPVQALRDWLQVSDTRFGPVFRKIDRWGTIEHRRLVVGSVRAIVSRRTPRRARRSLRTAAP
jgi:site-specific recombinase XerC